MDRRRFLLGLAGAFAAATLMASGSKMAEALPLQPPPDLPPDPIPEPAVATEADLEAAKAQEAYWVVRRRLASSPCRVGIWSVCFRTRPPYVSDTLARFPA